MPESFIERVNNINQNMSAILESSALSLNVTAKAEEAAISAQAAVAAALSAAVKSDEIKNITVLARTINAGLSAVAAYNEMSGEFVFDIPKGDTGEQGIQGIAGEQGIQGTQGIKGDTGDQGIQGTQGIKGDTGDQGIQGIQGIKGDTGDQGIQGTQGIKGDTGDQGIQGTQGIKGDTGDQGIQGTQGIKGDTGDQGIQGTQGIKGDTGDQGIQGTQGIKGDTGEQGIQGIQGIKGDTGDQGIQGIKGDTGDQGIQGIKGDTGDQGIQGIHGLDGTGSGDMLKYVYDTNNNGKVDTAEVADKAIILQIGRTINGVSFDGSENISINAVDDTQRVAVADIQDILTSTDTTKPLSAKQGKVLKDLIDNLVTLLGSNDVTLDTLQEIVSFIKLNKTTLDSLGIANIAGLETALSAKADATHDHTGTYQPLDADLTAIGALAATVGFLKKTAADTWAIITLAKADVGLANVDNTSDANKPISDAQAAVNSVKVSISDIQDILTSTDAAKPLSAKQGKVLKDLIDNLVTLLGSNDVTLDTLQEIVSFIKINRTTLDALGIANIAGLQTALNAKSATTHNHTGTYQPLDADLTAIGALAATVGFLKKTAADTWAIITLTKADVGLGNVDNTADSAKPVSSAQQTALNLKLALSGGTMTGAITSLRETSVAIAASNLDLSLANHFTKTVSTATTLTVSNVPASGQLAVIVLELTNGGSSVVTWWAGIKWAGGVAPTLTSAGIDTFVFYTSDGGTSWKTIGKDVK